MEEKKFVTFKKEELGVRDYIKRALGKGRISAVDIEYTPVGEKIVIATSKPGLIIGKGGEKIAELTEILRKKFHLENPRIDIKEITEPYLDAQLVSDEIALLLERSGPLRFKMTAYKMLGNIMKAGALGAEIVLSGKLPSERARSWRFSEGYLKKTGNPSKVVDRAISQAKTIPGVVGIKVSILPPKAHIHDQIIVDDAMRQKARDNAEKKIELEVIEEPKPKKTKSRKKPIIKEAKDESA